MTTAARCLKTACVLLALHAPLCRAYETFDISFISDQGTSNLLGFALNPTNGNMVLTSLSYGGQDNVWELSPSGALLHSTRAPFDTGPGGNLGSIAFGLGNSFYAYAVKFDGVHYDQIERSILHLDSEATTVLSSFDASNYGLGGDGMAYDTGTNTLLVSSYARKEVDEVALTGELLHSWNLSYSSSAIALDPLTGRLFAVREIGDFIDEYARGADGTLTLQDTYAFGTRFLEIDFDRANGRLFAENNTSIVAFGRDELVPITSTVPAPPTVCLLVAGLLVLVPVTRHRRNRLNDGSGSRIVERSLPIAHQLHAAPREAVPLSIFRTDPSSAPSAPEVFDRSSHS